MSDVAKPINLRLTQTDRDSVIRRAVAFAFDKKKQELQEEENSIGREAYSILYPEKVRKLANSLPEKWLREDECLRFSFKGMQTTINVKPGVRVPSGIYSCNRLGEVSDEKLHARFLALESAKEDMRKAEREVSANLVGLMSRFNTLSSLRAGWPDGSKFYGHLRPKEGASVPSVQIDAINKMLGIKAARGGS